MEGMCCIKCTKYRKFKNPDISYIFDRTIVRSIICDECGSIDENLF